MDKKLYRVLNEREQVGRKYSSKESSPRKQAVKKLYDQINTVLNLALACDIKISTALRVATQYGWVIEDIQNLLQHGETELPLNLFLVHDETEKSHISMNSFVNFFIKYNGYYQDSGIFLDEDKGDGQYFWEVIWERVRRSEFPDSLSRLESTFAFDDETYAIRFAAETRGTFSGVVEVEVADAEIQEYDMQWVSEVPVESTVKEAMIYARNYWRGQKTTNPIMEFLIAGEYTFNNREANENE